MRRARGRRCGTAKTVASCRPVTPPRLPTRSSSSAGTKHCASAWERPVASACGAIFRSSRWWTTTFACTMRSRMDSERIARAAADIVSRLTASGATLATAESCTGGWIAKAITDVPGSSAVLGYGIVSYSNAAKESLLGVRAETLAEHGAVSEAVVREMAEGALALSGANYSIAVSGIAGPDGGTAEKPVGTVWFAWARQARGRPAVETAVHRLDGDREAVRRGSVLIALEGLRDRVAGG